MSETQKSIKELRELFSGAGLDFDEVRAGGFDSYQLTEITKGLESGVDVKAYLDPEMPWTEMEEYRLELEQGVDLSEYRSKGFSTGRLAQIRQGLVQGVDVSIYARMDYLSEQMKEIREGLAEGLPIMFYKDPAFNYMQMAEIRKGLAQNVDISKYARPDMSYRKMRAVREALAKGVLLDEEIIEKYEAGVIDQIAEAKNDRVDIMPFAKDGYDAEQLEEIRHALVSRNKEFMRLLNKQYRGESLREIRLGLEAGVDVTRYASIEYSWEQMREIRLGLEARVNTKVYEKPLYNSRQMREIRKGLEAGLDVSYYTSMVYSSREMRLRRRAIENVMRQKDQMQSDIGKALDGVGHGINTSDVTAVQSKTDEEKIKPGRPFVTISDDGLEADIYIPFKVGQTEYTVEKVMEVINRSSIKYGLDHKAIAQLVEKKLYNRHVRIARGEAAIPGKGGWYEYDFDTSVPSQPLAMPDNSINYEEMKFFELVSSGQKVAVYHEAEFGNEGRNVHGEVLPAVKGRELPILKGYGVMMMEDRKSWCATVSGEIRLKNYEITVRPIATLEDANDPDAFYEFPGSVLITGNVTVGVTVKAKGDIIVRGKVDGARLDTDGNVCVVGGTTGMSERSLIRAGGKVSIATICDTDIRAGGNINANHIMDSNLVTSGRVNVAGQRGSISGGEIQAQKGLSCAVLGSMQAKRTIVQLGATGELNSRYQNCLKSLSKVESEIVLLRNERERINGQANNAIKTQNQIKVGQTLTIKENEENELIQERARLENDIQNVSGAKARISHVAYAGSVIIIDGLAKQLNSDITDPNGLLFRKDGNAKVAFTRNPSEGDY
ncbi:MAG: FapA family protein [Lachnospiraceae bacterium]|nr:FapA family protein [Lachnospiraceae bacterium]